MATEATNETGPKRPAPESAGPPAPADESNPSGFLESLGRFLIDHAHQIPGAADGFQKAAGSLGPILERLPGEGLGPSGLSERIDRVYKAVEALTEKVDRAGNSNGADPFSSVILQGLEDLPKQFKGTIRDELRPLLDQVKVLAVPQPPPEPPRAKAAEGSADLKAAKKEAEDARAELARARDERDKNLREKAQENAKLSSELHIRSQQAEKFRGEVERLKDQIGKWRQAALGDELASDEASRAVSDELVAAALRGETAAVGLLGNLMAFQIAPPDRLPNLLKDIGEAYYAWRPRSHGGTPDDDPFEASLVRFLLGRCERHGVKNKIELVRAGARFNADKHRADGAGGTSVAEVRGWVVARENGQPLHRATVVAR